jgi:diguanylate cyclase (GGDEF)-like protein
MLDIDNFKLVNDSLGHKWGDVVLQKVAEQLSNNLRNLDFVARYGGEEFIIILPETGLAGAIETANRLRLAIKETPVQTANGLLAVTASIGVSSNLVKGPTDHTQMASDADQALYQAKKSGKDRVGTLCVLEESGPISVVTDQMN